MSNLQQNMLHTPYVNDAVIIQFFLLETAPLHGCHTGSYQAKLYLLITAPRLFGNTISTIMHRQTQRTNRVCLHLGFTSNMVITPKLTLHYNRTSHYKRTSIEKHRRSEQLFSAWFFPTNFRFLGCQKLAITNSQFRGPWKIL